MLGREGGREGAQEGGRKAGRAGGWVCPGPRTSLHRRRRCPPARERGAGPSRGPSARGVVWGGGLWCPRGAREASG